ncbi:DUF1750-domain-containing protein [Trichodelitschia bisporula]|uniref:DUF1750-domain-containing protein n=1 Tax=Trichodelitschia bisporula TaxID=703511 RepID=A0A6G1I2A5_9PEZI|nr:DUF1750-domain-containing protein [Trichodelitschia bisporula]
MQDPSNGVPPALLPHVHLISAFRYPLIATLEMDKAWEFLLNAPRIVKEMAPMAWQYLQVPPTDGQVFLTWQPAGQRGNKLSSDGYVWADAESTFHYEKNGYTVEVLIHRSGYVPNRDQISCHTRQRFHIIGKAPNIPGPVDPSLWVVHYGQADPASRLPVNRISVTPEVQRMMHERRFVESQGQLARKEFMLFDRANWPQVSFTPAQHMGPQHPPAAYAGNSAMQPGTPMGRPGQYYTPAQGAGPPPKRQRQAPPSQVPVAPGMPPMPGAVDTSIEDEENTSLGDYLDHLTPVEISRSRFKQHHEWMEEVYSSVYSMSQIVPEDLGLGQVGELARLTDGIFEPPNSDVLLRPAIPSDKAPTPKTDIVSRRYRKLDPGKFTEFQQRVDTYLKESEQELEEMRAAHARTLESFRQMKTYAAAERQLARTGPEDKTLVENIVHELESTLDVDIVPRKDVICVQKGGLEEDRRVNGRGSAPGSAAHSTADGAHGNGSVSGGSVGGNGHGTAHSNHEDNTLASENTAAGLLNEYGSASFATTPIGRIATPQGNTPAASGSGPSGPQHGHGPFLHGQSGLAQPDSASDTGLDLIEGMDLDVDLAALGGDKPDEDWVMIDQNQHNAAPAQHPPPAQARPVAAAAPGPSAAPVAPAAPRSEAAAPSPATAGAVSATGATPDMFGDFVDDGNLDTAGDALADYATGAEELGLDLDGSEFGGAFGGTPASGA